MKSLPLQASNVIFVFVMFKCVTISIIKYDYWMSVNSAINLFNQIKALLFCKTSMKSNKSVWSVGTFFNRFFFHHSVDQQQKKRGRDGKNKTQEIKQIFSNPLARFVQKMHSNTHTQTHWASHSANNAAIPTKRKHQSIHIVCVCDEGTEGTPQSFFFLVALAELFFAFESVFVYPRRSSVHFWVLCSDSVKINIQFCAHATLFVHPIPASSTSCLYASWHIWGNKCRLYIKKENQICYK